MLARASSFILVALAIDCDDHLAVRLAAEVLFDIAGGGILLAGSTGRLTIRGILVGVADGCRESIRSDELDGTVLIAGEPAIDGRPDFCPRIVLLES
jgi:hypothetical protein